jgi:pentatricopeptide repeat protein
MSDGQRIPSAARVAAVDEPAGSRDDAPSLGQQRKPEPPQAERNIQALEDPGVLVKMGERARRRHSIREAVQCFERALALDPHHRDALSGLGFTFLDLRDYSRAIECFEKGLEQDRDSGRFMYGAAIALFELGRLDVAHAYATRLASRPEPVSRSNGHFIAGNVAYRRGDFASAAAHLAQAATFGPGQRGWRHERRRQEIRILLAEAYLALGHTEHALEVFEQMLRSGWSPGVADRVGQLYLEMERIPEAQAVFARILEQRPNDIRALTGLGRARLYRHEYAQATDIFDQVLRLDPTDLRALEGMAEAYRGAGNLDEAAKYIEQVQAASLSPEAQVQRQLRALARERERHNAELLRVRNIASLNVMATGMAHELRQPLSVIGLAAQNARRDLEEGRTELLAQDLRDIEEHVEKIDRIITLLRDVSTGSSGHLQSLHLQAVLDRALALFQRQLEYRGIHTSCHDLDLQVTADEPMLLQILVNLIGNARDAMAEAETKQLEIWTDSSPERVSLYVRDTGSGMSHEIERQAFDPFFTTKKGHGVGVGLYIAYNLARNMNGELSIKKTAPGKGTTMELSLPRTATGGA